MGRDSRKDTTMKAGLAIIVLGSTLALMTSGVNAYQSRANGSQSYPNYDRQEYQNRSCCPWKTSHNTNPPRD